MFAFLTNTMILYAASGLARGVTAPLSGCTCAYWANTNRLSLIAVWQKHMELEQNPPKTTTLSRGVNAEPGDQRETGGRCFVYHPERIHPKEKHRGEMRGGHCPTPCRLRENRMWWVFLPEVTGEPRWHQLGNLWFYWSKQLLHLFSTARRVFLFFFCLLLHLEADKCVKEVGPHATLSMTGIDMKPWIELRLRGFFFFTFWKKENSVAIRTRRHYVPFTAQVTGVVFLHCQSSLIAFYSYHKGLDQRQDMSSTVWDMLYIGIIFIFSFYHKPTPDHTQPLDKSTVSLGLCPLKC